jgi:hypothetical protein
MKTVSMLAFCSGSLFVAAAASAGISHSQVTPPGGFLQTGAYVTNGGSAPIPGADMEASLGTGPDFHEQFFAGNASASLQSQASNATVSNSVSATTGMGYFRVSAQNTFPPSNFFNLALGNGGWKETFTVNHPDLNGQPGFMVFQIRGRGTMEATGFNGSASVHTAGYKNNAELMTNALFNRGTSDAISTDRQRAQWALSSSGTTVSRTVDSTVTMAVPITFGQSFTLGLYVRAGVGQRSSAGVAGVATSTLSFGAHGVTWAGIPAVHDSTGPVTGYTIVTGTGIDWTNPYTPCGNADFDGDGDSGTDADIEAFFACLGGNCCLTCGSADFDGDGDSGTDADIEAFFSVLGGGGC